MKVVFVMVDVNKRILWLDVETTGVDAQVDSLLQVACIVTDSALNILHDKGFERKVFYSADQVEKLKSLTDDYVVNMHESTGLWSSLPVDGVSLSRISDELCGYIDTWVDSSYKARLGGNSITLDRNFIEVNLPDVFSRLNYRSYDMSSVGGFFDLFVPDVKKFEKKGTHDALDDIRESIAEAQYYAKFLKKISV